MAENAQPADDVDAVRLSLNAMRDIRAIQADFAAQRRARYVLQKPMLGRQLLSAEEVSALVKEREEEQSARTRKVKACQLEISQPAAVLPLEYQGASANQQIRYHIAQPGTSVAVQTASLDCPDFAPSGAALLEQRKHNLAKLRKAANIVIWGIRAQKMLRQLREAFNTSARASDSADFYASRLDLAAGSGDRDERGAKAFAIVSNVLLRSRDDISIAKLQDLEQTVEAQDIEKRLGVTMTPIHEYYAVSNPAGGLQLGKDLIAGFPVSDVQTQILSCSLARQQFTLLEEMPEVDYRAQFW